MIVKLFKTIKKFITNHSTISVCLLLFVIVLISYGKTINMYWWVDDWGLLFKMVHPESTPGNLGYGIWGSGAYRFLATPFILLYPYFGVDAKPYFILALVQYFLASCVVYLFVRTLTKNNLIAIGSSVIFASGYIGSFAMYRLSNSYQLIDTTILIYLSGYFVLRYLESGGKAYFWNYFLSLLTFFGAMYLMYLRSHGIIVVIGSLVVYYIVANWKTQKKRLPRRIFEFAPFLLLYYYNYVLQYAGAGGNMFKNFVEEIFVNKNYYYFNNLIYSYSVVIVPDSWIFSIFSFLKKNIVFVPKYFKNGDFLIISIGYILLLLSVSLPVLLKKFRNILIYLPVASFFILGNIFSYFIYMPTNGLESNHRYIMPAFVGGTIFTAGIFLFMGKLFSGRNQIIGKLIYFILITTWSIGFIRLSNFWQKDVILRYVSNPTRAAYAVIKKTVPHVDADTVFFIDTEDEAAVKNNVLSGMGQLGISIFYNYNDETKIIDNYQNLCSQILKGKIKLENLYTFFESERLGLVPTTDQFKKELYQKLPRKRINKWVDNGVYQESEVDFPILMPARLTITISLSPSSGKTSSEPQTIKMWWLTERARTYRPYYLEEINIAPDGKARTYSFNIPAGGLAVQSLRIDNHPPNRLEVLEASIVNLTIPEAASVKEIGCK